MEELAYDNATCMQLKNVQFYGVAAKDIISTHFKNGHLFLHPDREESFRVVLIETMALGVPVIGGKKSGGVPWVVGIEDLLVDVANYKKIEQKLDLLLFNKTL